MDDLTAHRPATQEELSDALSFALRYDGRKCHRLADDFQARITADHLLKALERHGFVILKRPLPTPGPGPRLKHPSDYGEG